MADEPASDILDATHRTLCEYGYADLTLQDIAAEADISKSSIHYHYDSKDQLFVTFLDELFDRFIDRIDTPEGETPHEQLDTLLQVLLTSDTHPDVREFRTAMLELKAQAPYNPALQERLTKFDEFLFEQFREVLAKGVTTGQFDETIDPPRAAEYLTTVITGAHTRHIAINQSSDWLYDTMTRYIERHLLADEYTEVAQ